MTKDYSVFLHFLQSERYNPNTFEHYGSKIIFCVSKTTLTYSHDPNNDILGLKSSFWENDLLISRHLLHHKFYKF